MLTTEEVEERWLVAVDPKVRLTERQWEMLSEAFIEVVGAALSEVRSASQRPL